MIKAASASRHGGGGGGAEDDDDVPASSVEEVEMGLLAHDERASSSRESFMYMDGDGSDGLEEDVRVRAAAGRDGYGHGHGEAAMKAPLTREDKKAMALLIVLCASLAFSPPPVLRCVYRPCRRSLISPTRQMLRCAWHSARLFLLFRYHPGRPGESLLPHMRAYRRGGRSSLSYLPTTFATSSSA